MQTRLSAVAKEYNSQVQYLPKISEYKNRHLAINSSTPEGIVNALAFLDRSRDLTRIFQILCERKHTENLWRQRVVAKTLIESEGMVYKTINDILVDIGFRGHVEWLIKKLLINDGFPIASVIAICLKEIRKHDTIKSPLLTDKLIGYLVRGKIAAVLYRERMNKRIERQLHTEEVQYKKLCNFESYTKWEPEKGTESELYKKLCGFDNGIEQEVR